MATRNSIAMDANTVAREKIASDAQQRHLDRRSKERIARQDRAFKGGLETGKTLMSSFNDPAWYNPDDTLFKNVLNLNWDRPLAGAQESTGTANDHGELNPVTGLVRIKWVPSCGINTTTLDDPEIVDHLDADSGANLGGMLMYRFMRNDQRISMDYDPSDLTMMLIAVSDVYSNIASLIRAYGLLSRFDPKNLLGTQGLVAAICGEKYVTNYGSIDLADLRTRINRLISMVNVLNVPDDFFTLKKKYIWLSSHIYKNDDQAKTSYYYYQKDAYYTYYEDLSILGCKAIPTGEDNIENLIQVISTQLNGLVTNETILNMSGDIARAFGQEKCFKYALLDSSFKVEPEYNPEVIKQFCNIRYVGQIDVPSAAPYLQIFGNTRGVHQGIGNVKIEGANVTKLFNTYGGLIIPKSAIPNISQSYAKHPTASVLLQCPGDSMTPDELMVATRSISLADDVGTLDGGSGALSWGVFNPETLKYEKIANEGYLEFHTVGSEIITAVEFDTIFDPALNVDSISGDFVTWPAKLTVTSSNIEYQYAIVLAQLEYMPAIPTFSTGAQAYTLLSNSLNCQPISVHVLQQMNQVALMAEFGATSKNAVANIAKH